MTIHRMPRTYRQSIRYTPAQKGDFRQKGLIIGLAVLFVAVLIATVVVATNLANAFFNPRLTTGQASQSNSSSINPHPTSTVTLSSGPLQASDGPAGAAWDGKSRINILVMGLDYRDWVNYDIPHSDTMILVTIDPATHTAGMLSIPRDMWVSIPDHYEAKINSAYFLGEAEHLPGGGPGLAMKTVQQFLGVPVHYYAQVDFIAFSNFVDQIGGITIDVPADITVDPLGPGNTTHLKAGTQHMFGPVALAYARARYTANGDFDRAGRQQQVIIGIRDRILKPNVWPTLIANAPGLYQSLASGVHTNLTFDQLVKLALIARQIPMENIKHSVISPDMVTFSTSWDGQDILLPDMAPILKLRDQIFSTEGAIAPLPTSAPATPVQATPTAKPTTGSVEMEKARISVQNGTQVSGLASRTGDYLKTLGLNVIEETNADPISLSMMIVYSNKPYTTSLLAKSLNIPSSRIFSRQGTSSNVDIVLVLGDDWAASNDLPAQ